MARCLAIVLCLISLRVLPQCTTINYNIAYDLDCLTSNITCSVWPLNGVAPYTFSYSPSVPQTVIGNTSITTYSAPSGGINFVIKDVNGCTHPTSQIVISIFTFNSLMNVTTVAGPGTKSVSCFGGSDGALTLTVTGTTATPPFTYSVNGAAISGNTVTGLTAGIYTLTGKDNDGCSRTTTVNITEPAPMNSTTTTSLLCFGSSTAAAITTTGGNSPFTYTVNGSAITGNVINNLVAGTHTIFTQDSKNCTRTNIIVVTQPASPALNFVVTQPSCPTSSNGGLSVSISNLQSPYNYTWTAPTNTNSFLSNIPQGVYTLTVKDANSCLFTKTVSVVPVSNIQTNINTKPETCSAVDAAATINVTGATLPLTYSVSSFPSQSSNTFSNLATGLYTVLIVDANTCSVVNTFSIGNTSPVQLSIISQTDILCYNNCDGALTVSVNLAVQPVTYSLTGLPTYTTSTLTNICSGTYTLRAVDNIGCYAITTATFNSPAAYNFSVSGNSPICISKSANLAAQAVGGTAPYSYLWLPGGMNTSSIAVSPSVTTVYSLNVYDSKNCTLNPATFTVFVRAPLTVSVSPQNSGICPGTTAQITPSVSGGDGNYSYQWLPGNINTASIYLSNLTNPTYTFMVSDGCGSPTNTTIINLQIFPVTVPTFSTDTAIGCQPLCVQFKNTTPSSINHYWNFGDVPFEQNVQDPFYCYTRSGSFNVKLTLTDLNGCKVSATYSNYIHVLQQPIPNFISRPEILTDDLGEGQLLNSSGNTSSVSWYLNGAYQGNGNNTTIPCTDTVCYIVKLIADNSNGCKDSLERLICIKPGFTFYMPNTFSPNNDGLNDELLPYGRSWISDNYKFRIFNRWGQMIFQTSDIKKGWDGKIKGNFVLNDNYYWMVFVTDYYGTEHAFQGSVILLR
jgi:gliding motility-associated-like protein